MNLYRHDANYLRTNKGFIADQNICIYSDVYGLYFGAGLDVVLSRGAANRLDIGAGDFLGFANGTIIVDRTDPTNRFMYVHGAGYGSWFFGVHTAGHSPAFRIKAVNTGQILSDVTMGGQLQLPVSGSGAGLLIGGDVSLYRSAANCLHTDDNFEVVGPDHVKLYVPKVYIGALDTNLYRSAANVLKTDDNFELAGDIGFQAGASYRFGSLDTASWRNIFFRTATHAGHGFTPEVANTGTLGDVTYYWGSIYGNLIHYKSFIEFACSKEMSGLPVTPRFKTDIEAEDFLKREMTKKRCHIEYGKKEGTLVCTCGKEVERICPEHEEEWKEKYTLNTGEIILATAKMVLSLLERIKALKELISKETP